MKTYTHTYPIAQAFGTMTLTAAFVAFSLGVFAQEPIIVTMDPMKSSSSTRNSYSVDIPQVSLKDVERDWLKHVGKHDKGKASVVNGEYVQTGAVNKNISPEPFTYYSKLVETPTGIRLTSWLGQNNIVSASGVANANQDLAVQKFMRDFAVDAYREAVKAELKMEEDKLSDLEKGVSKVIRTEEKTNKTIIENERDNEMTEDAIATNKRDIKSATQDITDQKDMVDMTAADPNANKGAKKTLDEMKDDKKDLQKENEKKNEDIADRNKEIRAADRKMDAAHNAHDNKATAIETQREVVAAVKRKLAGIK